MIVDGKIIASEKDIDRSKVIISNHAIERFFQRSIKKPKNYDQAKEWLTNWFLGSDHRNAIDPVSRTRRLIDYGECFFFRNGRLQFVVVVGGDNDRYPNKLVMVTVVFLNDREFSFLSR